MKCDKTLDLLHTFTSDYDDVWYDSPNVQPNDSVVCGNGDRKFTEIIKAHLRVVIAVIGHQWKEACSVFIATSPQVFIYIENISPDPSLLWAAVLAL